MGAEEHALPPEYQSYLRRLPTFVPETSWRGRIGASSFLWFGRRIVRVLATFVKRTPSEGEECPSWYGSMIWAVYSAMWLWHDCVHAILFGRGDGGSIKYIGIQLQ